MFGRKKTPVDGRLEFENLKAITELAEQVNRIESRVMQLTCTHNFGLEKCTDTSVVFKCSKCTLRKIKTKRQLTEIEQHALKVFRRITHE